MTISITLRYAFDSSINNAPICVLMHGYTDSNTNFAQSALERIAGYGFFVVATNLRSSKDSSGREIYDIRDAVEYIRTNFANFVSSDKAVIVGYSGGGGNALAAACKFPDYWTTVVSHFGMSDYGYNNPSGWWYQTAIHQATIESRIGGNPATVPNAYRARNARDGIKNYTGGHVYFFHDDGDTSVEIDQSQNLVSAMTGFGLANYTENYTDSGDATRWTHGYPNGDPLQQTETYWKTNALSNSAWTIAASGSVRVIGYCITKRFEVWLGTTTRAGAGGGLDEVADVVYNTATNTYTVTPLTGACDVYIKQGSLTGTASGITAETEIVVS